MPAAMMGAIIVAIMFTIAVAIMFTIAVAVAFAFTIMFWPAAGSVCGMVAAMRRAGGICTGRKIGSVASFACCNRSLFPSDGLGTFCFAGCRRWRGSIQPRWAFVVRFHDARAHCIYAMIVAGCLFVGNSEL